MDAKFNLRELNAKDIFSVSRIIGKIGVGNFKKCFNSDEIKTLVGAMTEEDKKDEKKVSAVGITAAIEIADVLFMHLPDCERELYSFLSSVSGVKAEELSMPDFLELIIEVIKKPEFKDFFKVALRSFK